MPVNGSGVMNTQLGDSGAGVKHAGVDEIGSDAAAFELKFAESQGIALHQKADERFLVGHGGSVSLWVVELHHCQRQVT
jgi:hypothetical protein